MCCGGHGWFNKLITILLTYCYALPNVLIWLVKTAFGDTAFFNNKETPPYLHGMGLPGGSLSVGEDGAIVSTQHIWWSEGHIVQ